ncbi:response regulator [Giesbergeria anulus]|uniref:Putative two-component system response regulator n=1 Tax=Giesbergeria anulus TaxID=180197 RepID=A0A1H9F2F0_9BURK|nr:HD domain-containing phosphohydrolase [Giesbergeria anulus]SEQ32122.1 putative two-component system response regulator [Giesbergeria anulus]
MNLSAAPTAPVATILVVDDEERNVKLLEVLLQAEGYATVSALNGREALAAAVSACPDLILLDIMMPDMDGFETVAQLKANPRTRQVPVIMVTSLDDRDTKQRALLAGAEEFLSKPIIRADLTVRVRNLLRLKQYSDLLTHHNQLLETQVKERTAQLEEAYRDTVLTLVRAAERKDEETGHHVRRISHYCVVLADAMALPEVGSDVIFHASPMHDIGKIGIPDHVLLKPGPLTPDEWATMQTHCALGARILSSGTSRYTRMGAEIALGHHERWDGSGYPAGLRGTDIPMAARLMQICDVYDALRSRRPYKPDMEHAQAVDIIVLGDGRTQPEHFDPAVLACFVAQAPLFAAIYEAHPHG